MSVANVMNTGLSALLANQTALRSTSNNVANVNTPGYVRQDVQMTPLTLGGRGAGVEANIRRSADQFLTDTHTKAISSHAQYDVAAGLLDRAQASLGDPASSTSLFAGLDDMLSKASGLINNPSSSLTRSDMVASVQATFEDFQRGYQAIDQLRDEADLKLRSTAQSANLIMEEIAGLNAEIQRITVANGDASGALTQQSRLMNDLAEIVDFRVQQRPIGGVELRTNSGVLLVDHRAAELKIGEGSNGARFSGLLVSPPGSDAEVDITRQLQSGELRGLLTVRDHDLPDLTYALGELSAGLTDQLNQANNAGTSVPAPQSLTGRNTGLQATDTLNFTGQSVFGVVDASGRTIESVTVDFDAGTMTNSAGAVTAFGATVGGFATGLQASFGAAATVSFADGQLNLSTTAGNGVAVADVDANPSNRAGRGVSAFFGLNDLVTSNSPAFYNTGLTGTDSHGFVNGGQITFGFRDEQGDLVQEVSYTPGGVTLNDIVADLTSGTQLGSYANVSIDSNGRLNVTPRPGSGILAVDVMSDTTSRGSTGVSMSELFGLGIEGPAERARSLKVRDDIAINNNLLATAKFNTAATAVGTLSVAPGDNSGALDLQAAITGNVGLRTISGVDLPMVSLADAAAQFASDAGAKANFMEGRAASADATRLEAETRRASVEGVNLDEEMVNMTIYQQSYNAASRLIQAASDMYDVLLNMV